MIDKQKLLMKKIEYYGEEYLNCFPKKSVLSSGYISLDELTKELNNNCWVSLEYLLHHTFMRGRKDELSEKYYKHTIRKLKELFNINTTQNREKLNLNYNTFVENVNQYTMDYKNIYNIKNQEEFLKYIFNNDNKLIKLLRNKNNEDKILKNENEHPLNNYKDIVMVLGILNFVKQVTNENKNITKYFIENIANDKIKDSYIKLLKIKFIGPKIASFYLRDLTLVHGLQNIPKCNYQYLFPMDTWIRQVCQKVGIIDNNKLKEFEVREKIISKCLENDINPLLFNQGCWFVGYFSFDLLINLLKIFEKNLKLNELDILKCSMND